MLPTLELAQSFGAVCEEYNDDGTSCQAAAVHLNLVGRFVCEAHIRSSVLIEKEVFGEPVLYREDVLRTLTAPVYKKYIERWNLDIDTFDTERLDVLREQVDEAVECVREVFQNPIARQIIDSWGEDLDVDQLDDEAVMDLYPRLGEVFCQKLKEPEVERAARERCGKRWGPLNEWREKPWALLTYGVEICEILAVVELE